MENNDDESRQRAERDMAAIKAREAQVKAAIVAGGPIVDTGSFGMSQLGLSPCVADRDGRIWRVDGQTMTLVYPMVPRGYIRWCPAE